MLFPVIVALLLQQMRKLLFLRSLLFEDLKQNTILSLSLKRFLILQKRIIRYRYSHQLKNKVNHIFGRRKIGRQNLEEEHKINLQSNLGIDSRFFRFMLSKLVSCFNGKRDKKSMSLEKRLYIVLYWLRKYPSYTTLGDLFGTSGPTLSRVINHLLPHLVSCLDFIKIPDSTSHLPHYAGAVAAIDCSAHPRLRPHPLQSRFYNGAKQFHCLYVQVLCGLNGHIYDVYIGEGKNNDRGMLTVSGVNAKMREKNMKALGDRGYNTTSTIVAPKDNPNNIPAIDFFNHEHYHFRAVVETVFGRVKTWKAAEIKFKQLITTQGMALLAIYNIVAKENILSPIRDEGYLEN